MEINFCDCGSIMVPAGDKIQCRFCGKTVNKKMDAKIVTQKEKQDVIVFENNEPDLPKTEKQCDHCGNNEAYFWLIQTRASDEPPTQFFRCIKCRHVWREYK
ncbi:MAG: transcription factor S [Candidatus Aenigmarchaeota archaeon]|nr:transcription factor S [Candidatus Aenigmarchaeota archaeon]